MKILHSSSLNICQEAINLLRQEQKLREITPDAPSKVERACYFAYERSRQEVLTCFPWSFLKEDMVIRNGGRIVDANGRYKIAYPSNCVKVLQCYGEDNHKIQYTVRGTTAIYSLEPIKRITYLVDEEDIDILPTLVRKAIINVLARNLCLEVTGRTNDCQLMEMQATTAINAAKTDDARIGSTGNEVYGRNYLYDCAIGKRNPFVRKGL